MFSNVFLVLVSLLLLQSTAFSQAALMKHGDSGGGIIGGIAVNREGMFVQGSGIGTVYGRFDIAVTIGQEVFDGRSNAPPVTTIGVEVFPFRDAYRGGFPVSLSGIFQLSDISGSKFSTYGIAVYKRLGETRRSYIQPFASGFIIRESDRYGESLKGFTLGFSLASRIGNNALFSFTPSYSKVKASYTASLMIGFSFYSANEKIEDDSKF